MHACDTFGTDIAKTPFTSLNIIFGPIITDNFFAKPPPHQPHPDPHTLLNRYLPHPPGASLSIPLPGHVSFSSSTTKDWAAKAAHSGQLWVELVGDRRCLRALLAKNQAAGSRAFPPRKRRGLVVLHPKRRCNKQIHVWIPQPQRLHGGIS